MTEPYVQVLKWPGGGEIASVVIDVEDFDALCEDLRGIMIINPDDEEANERAADAQIQSLKAAKTVPMIGRGEKTEFLFERYDVEQDKMCVIVRGTGLEILSEIMKRDQATLN